MLLTNTLTNQPACAFRFQTVLLACLFLHTTTVNAQENPTALQNLIEEIEQHEKLYANLKLDVTSVNEMLPERKEADQQIRHVTKTMLFRHGNQYREEESKRGRFQIQYFAPPKKELRMHSNTGVMKRMQVYDGDIFRSYSSIDLTTARKDGKPIKHHSGEITDEPPQVSNLVRPHMFLFFDRGPYVPLSTFLKGPAAIAATPGAAYETRDRQIQVQILDEEKFAGFKCIRLSIKLVKDNGSLLTRHELWLAQGRNLIPVRKLSFPSHRSDTIPRSDSIVDTWQEIRPGVWFPHKAHQDENNVFIIIKENRQQRYWHREYATQDVELNPQLPEDIFTRLEFPPDTVMKSSYRGN
ncbi:hypothetical protein [Gimesia algae]|uniref:Outer membrane lipoprotein-sorting protein n=1 Tax=Gimesia algae TaxID=2527971 RepID=A0A517VGX9_9PLAN|nr:hypothetical protein [Gimesia algae]QDT92260.1 hypothetical protein Pan161_39270 [Gimesia algae]